MATQNANPQTSSKASQTRIVLSGYYGFDNIGDEAVLYSIITSLKREIPNVKIIVLSNNPEKTKKMYHVESVNRWKLPEITKVIKESDILISGGGSLLQDVTSGKTIPYYLAIIKIAQFFKKKVIFYSQGVGPVNKDFNKKLIKHVVNKVDGIYVRDKGSKQLLKDIGIKKDIGVALDPVLGIQVPNKVERTKTVGVYIRPWQDEAHDSNLIDSLIPALAWLIEQGYKICMIPMHYEQDKDIANLLGKKLIEKTGQQEAVEVINELLTIEEVVDKTARFELVIGMRLHSLIIAAANQVPIVAISYDPKVTQFMKEVNVPYCLDSKSLNKNTVLETIQKAERTRERQAEQLGKILETKRERIDLPLNHIRKLV